MKINIDKPASNKSAAIWALIVYSPFLFSLLTAITQLKPFIDWASFNGRATVFGLIIFYVGLIGLPLGFLINLLSILTVKLVFKKWSIDGKISFQPKPINLIIGLIGFLVALIFGGHLIIDSIACFNGNISACD